MTLKTVMESLTGRTTPATYDDLPELIAGAIPLLFSNFPLYDEGHRTELQNLIIGRYLNREICCTPFARWKQMFNQKLFEIMPYYNKLYKALDSNPDFNIFNDVDYSREIETAGTVTMEKGTTDTVVGGGSSHTIQTYTPGITQIATDINTPQTEIANFLDNKYLSGASKNWQEGDDMSEADAKLSNNNTVTRTGQDTDTENRKVNEKVVGKRGSKSYVELLKEYQESLFSVDTLILDALEEMFFMIY